MVESVVELGCAEKRTAAERGAESVQNDHCKYREFKAEILDADAAVTVEHDAKQIAMSEGFGNTPFQEFPFLHSPHLPIIGLRFT